MGASYTVNSPEVHDSLHEGGMVVSRKVTILQGQVLSRGALLGKQTKDSIGTVTPGGGNIGDGAPTAATLGASAEVGQYNIRCVAAAANGGTFVVETPSGHRLAADLTVGVAYVSDHVNLTIADGASDFVVGDFFTLDVAGSGKYLLSLGAAVDGSQEPDVVLVNDVDATAADTEGLVYVFIYANADDIIFGTGHTAASVREGLRRKGIFI